MQWLNSAGTGRNAVPSPLVGVPPPQTGVPLPPKKI